MRLTKIILCLFLLCVGVEGISFAQDILGWQDCVAEAKTDHPDLISAREKVNQVAADKSIARSNYLPQINSTANQQTSRNTAGIKSDSYSYGVSGQQLLFDGLKTIYNVRAASQNLKASFYAYQVTSSNIRLRLRTAFAGLLQAYKLLNITRGILKLRRDNYALVEMRYNAGSEHRGSLLSAAADLAQAEFEVRQSQRNILLANRSLIKELGRSVFSTPAIKGNFIIVDTDRLMPEFEAVAQGSPFLQELIARKEAARLGIKSAGADFFPQIYANASAGKTDSQWPPSQNQWSMGISVSFPLFEGGSRLAQYDKARAVFNQSQADERSGKDGVLLTLEQTWINLQNSIDNLGVQKKFLAAAKERSKIAQAEYSIGLITFDTWTIIEDAFVSAKKAFLNTQYNALIAEANWAQAKGVTLDENQ